MAKHSFRANAAGLMEWIGKRKASLEQERRPFEALWRDVRQYFEPHLGKALLDGDRAQRSASRDDEKILNSEPRILLHRMAAGLQSGITNQSRQWFRLRPVDQKRLAYASVRAWTDAATERVQSLFARSNFYGALDQIYLHLAQFGTAAALATPDPDTRMHMHVCDAGSYWIAEDRRGRVNTLMRRIEMTLAQVEAEFGRGWMPDQLVQLLDQGKHETVVTVYNLVCPNDGDRRWADLSRDRAFASVYWTDHKGDSNGGVLAIRGFDYNPIVAPRWLVFGSAYGTGCGDIGLGDCKELQALERDKLRLVAQEVDPSMLAPSSMKGEPIDTGPGGITYYTPDAAAGRAGPVQRLFETRGQIEALLLAIDATTQRLNRTFYSDLFALLINLQVRPKQMTAREVSELSAEKVALLGPILTRMNADLLDPAVTAGFAIAEAAGLIDQPPEILAGQPLRVEYVSTLHTEQAAAARLGGLLRLAEFTAQIASSLDPQVVDKFDADQAVDIAAESLTEHGVVRDDKAVEAIRAARAKEAMRQQQAAEQAASATAMARATRDLSEAKLGTGSALDALQQGGTP